jgi:hypothetical protein
MRKFCAVMVVLFAFSAHAGVVSSTVTTSKISRASPAHYVVLSSLSSAVAAGVAVVRVVYPHAAPARLVDVIMYQLTAGVGGTSWTCDIQNSASASLLSTVGVATLASGAAKVTDANGSLSLPSGWTRPVIKTDGSEVVTEGTYLQVFTTETGSYSTHVTAVFALVFEPLQ